MRPPPQVAIVGGGDGTIRGYPPCPPAAGAGTGAGAGAWALPVVVEFLPVVELLPGVEFVPGVEFAPGVEVAPGVEFSLVVEFVLVGEFLPGVGLPPMEMPMEEAQQLAETLPVAETPPVV